VKPEPVSYQNPQHSPFTELNFSRYIIYYLLDLAWTAAAGILFCIFLVLAQHCRGVFKDFKVTLPKLTELTLVVFSALPIWVYMATVIVLILWLPGFSAYCETRAMHHGDESGMKKIRKMYRTCLVVFVVLLVAGSLVTLGLPWFKLVHALSGQAAG